MEQVWGGRAHAASGWTGTGFAGTTALGRGIPVAVSYAENTFSVYVLSEHGALGGIAVLLLYLSLLVPVAIWIVRVRHQVQNTPSGLAAVAMAVGGVLWLTLPAAYVAASNIGSVPLTGQNMPFLGLNSWADVVLVSGVATGILFGLSALDTEDVAAAAAPRRAEPQERGGLPRRARRPGSDAVAGGRCAVSARGGTATRGGGVRLAFVGALVLGATAALLALVAVDVIRASADREVRRGLEYGHFLAAVDELLDEVGDDGLLRLEELKARLPDGRTVQYDTLLVVADQTRFPAFAPGGFLHDQTVAFNRFQRERLTLSRVEPRMFDRLAAYNPSIFRAYRRGDGTRGVTRTAAAWDLQVPSPFAEEWEGEVRANDVYRGRGVYGASAAMSFRRPASVTRRVSGRPQRCELRPDSVDVRAYCLSESRVPQVTFKGAVDPEREAIAVAGWTGLWVDGREVEAGDSMALGGGAVLEIEPLATSRVRRILGRCAFNEAVDQRAIGKEKRIREAPRHVRLPGVRMGREHLRRRIFGADGRHRGQPRALGSAPGLHRASRIDSSRARHDRNRLGTGRGDSSRSRSGAASHPGPKQPA